MAEEKKDDKKEKKEPQIVSVTLAAGQVKNRQVSVTAFVALGRRELAGKTVYFYVGQDYQQAATSATGADGRAGALIDIPADAKGLILVSAKAEGMPVPTSTTVDISEEEKKTAQVKSLYIESTWQGYDDDKNSVYQWIPRLFDEDNKSVAGVISISTGSSIKLVDGADVLMGTQIVREIPEKEVKIYKLTIPSLGTVEVDVFVQGCDVRREFQLRGKKVERTLGDPPAANANWWEKIKYGLKGGKL